MNTYYGNIKTKKLKKSEKNKLPIKKIDLKCNINQWANIIPYNAIKEIISWETTYKSPSSYSFYSKKKDWNQTIDGTIRVSDHWNFIAEEYSKRTGYNGIHAKTDVPVDEDVWYKGVYKNGQYEIVESYGKNGNLTKEQIIELKESISEESINKERIPFPQEIIDIRRQFTRDMEAGNVFIKINNEWKILRFLSHSQIDYEDNGEKIRWKSNRKEGSWLRFIPEIFIKYKDKEYNGIKSLIKDHLWS